MTPTTLSASRSRDDRLRDLDRERRLYSTRSTGSANIPSRLASSSSKPTSSRNDNSSRDSLDGDVCFASELGGLKGKIRVGKGRHAFVDEEGKAGGSVSKLVNRDDEDQRGRPKSRDVQTSKPVKPVTSARSASADAWKLLVNKETKNRTKVSALDPFYVLTLRSFYGTEKTLIVLLEEERERFSQLEEEYHKLLAEVQALQTSHLQDLRNLDRRTEADLKSLQRALSIKTDECTQSQKELAQFQGRYAKESAGWISANERLEGHVQQLDRLMKEMEKRADNQEKVIGETVKAKKDLSEACVMKEGENRKLLSMMKEKEAEWVKEKEMRMKLEVQALQLDHFVAQRDEEIKGLRGHLQKRTMEVEDLMRVRSQLEEARQDLDDLTKRERMYLDEIEQLTNRERKLFNEIEDMSASQKRALLEIERLVGREAALVREVETMKTGETKLQQELVDARNRINEEADEVAALQKQSRSMQMENAKILQELFDVRAQVQEQKVLVEQRDGDVRNLKETEFLLKRERDDARNEVAIRQAEIGDMREKMQDIGRRLEMEVQAKNEIRQQNKEKLVAVAEKISELQDSLNETQQQISELKQNESTLRTTLRQRDDTIASQQRQMNEHQQLIAELQSNLAKEAYVNESLRVKKKEELLALQEKYTTAKSAMDQESQNLRTQLTQKQIQATATLDEASRLKIEVSELTADRFRLEARLTELSALEASHSRQIANLQQQVRQRDQEGSVMGIKYQTLVEQLRRIDEEVGALKNVAGNEGGRLGMGIGDLSRRIKNQLGLLLDAAPSSTSTMFTSSAPPVATTRLSKPQPSRTSSDTMSASPGTLSSVPSTSERNVARGFFSTSPDREKSREREYKASSTFLAEERKARMGLENPKMISGLDEHLWEDDRRGKYAGLAYQGTQSGRGGEGRSSQVKNGGWMVLKSI